MCHFLVAALFRPLSSCRCDIAICCWPYAVERLAGQRDARFNRRNRSENRLGDPHALALAVRRLPGSCALLSWGFLADRASLLGGLMPALEPCPGWPAMVAVVVGASGKGATGASVAGGAGDAAGTTCQRASSSAPMDRLGGTSSSIATGTSGSAGFALAMATGCCGSTGAAGTVAGPSAVVSLVAVGLNESAVNERVTPIANSSANVSQMTVCYIVASPTPIEQKNRPYLPAPGSTAPDSFKINLGRLEAD